MTEEQIREKALEYVMRTDDKNDTIGDRMNRIEDFVAGVHILDDNILIEILVGLPGSGKTHYAEEIGGSSVVYSMQNIRYIDFDRELIYKYTFPQILRANCMAYDIQQRKNLYNHWIFDGLFLTNVIQHQLVHAIKEQLDKRNIKRNITIQFVYFIEDRETCLINDAIRNRDKLADITIKSAKFEKPNINELKKDFPKFNFTIIEKEVHKMNTYEKLFKIHESYAKNDIMKSESWSLGGSWGDCWGNHGTIEADKQPESFKEFDDLLIELCPNIGFLQYKKLYNKTVSIHTWDEHDYYGGCRQNAEYECDLYKLYTMMVEMNLIGED